MGQEPFFGRCPYAYRDDGPCTPSINLASVQRVFRWICFYSFYSISYHEKTLIFLSAFCLLFAFSALSGQSTSAYQYCPSVRISGILHNLSPSYLWSFRLDSNGLWHPFAPTLKLPLMTFPEVFLAPLVDQRTWRACTMKCTTARPIPY